jgi:hypothetical protein
MRGKGTCSRGTILHVVLYPTTPCQSLLPLVADHPLVRNHTHSCTQTNTGIVLGNGQRVAARAVVVNADPFRMRELAGAERFEPAFNSWLDERRRDGTTLKVNLALKELPRFACLPERRGQHNTTAHLLPPEADVLSSLTKGFADVQVPQ